MYQDIKNFYNLLAIDTANKLTVEIVLQPHDLAKYLFTVNNQTVDNQNLILYFDLFDSFHFNCSVTTGAVEVTRIAINGHEIMPVYLHLAQPNTNWITNNWELCVPGPFYPWYHKITGQGWIA
jgi:hypothetical protein